jgi:hypothetical protein
MKLDPPMGASETHAGIEALLHPSVRSDVEPTPEGRIDRKPQAFSFSSPHDRRQLLRVISEVIDVANGVAFFGT